MPFIATAYAAEMSAHPCAELVPVQNGSILDRYYLVIVRKQDQIITVYHD
jgi:hypothetical protein